MTTTIRMPKAVAALTATIIPLVTFTVPVFAQDLGTRESRNDILNGSSDSDILNGFEGDDMLFGEDNNDILDGGSGNDEIYGGEGDDEIKDGNDSNLVNEADYGNKVYGGSGNDKIDVGINYTRSDFYYVYGEDGSDYIKAISNADIKGGLEDDIIYCIGYECNVNGNEGNDEIHVLLYDVGSSINGGIGDDKVFGKGYSVNGDQGNDYLSLDSALELKGSEGDDVLEVVAPSWETYYNGGSGADIFNCSHGPGDIVEDYNPKEGDVISEECEVTESFDNDTLF
jgi:Ca2+-binding RTX toxin-like protein